MNDIAVFIYIMGIAVVFGMTCVYMYMMMRSTISEFDKRTVRSYGDAMRAYKSHPEEPKDGEEVMGVTFKNQSCDLNDYDKLQSRINELKKKLEGEEDDDGDILVSR